MRLYGRGTVSRGAPITTITVTADLDVVYSVFAVTVNADLAAAYNVLNFVQANLTPTYNVAVLVTANLTGTYQIGGATTRADLVAVYSVAAFPRYIDLVPSYDLDNVFNKWVITRTDGEPQVWEDAASQQDYFLRVKQQASLVTTDGEALNQAQWKSGQFSKPLNRVESITIMPLKDLNDTDQISAGLGREIADRIRVVETPPGFSTPQTNEYVIQHLSGQIDVGPHTSAKLTFLLWPASVSSFWIAGDPDQSLVGVSTKPGY